MPKRLWVASVSFEMVVLADTEADALRLAVQHAAEEACHEGGRVVECVTPVLPHGMNSLPVGWSDCIPWGSEDDRTCAQLLSKETEG